MTNRLDVRIAAVAGHLPSGVVTNDELALQLDTTDAWIASRTGIRQRHVAAEDEATSDLATVAGAKALAASGFDADELGAIVVATTTADHPMPGVAPLVAHQLGIHGATAFDLQAACIGFVHGLGVVGSMVAATQRPALLIGAEVLTRIANDTDRSTAVLFGDGAGAVVLAPADGRGWIGPTINGVDGSLAPILRIEAGGTRTPTTPLSILQRRNKISMQGREVYRHAVEQMAAASAAAINAAGLELADIDLFVPHQANARILGAVAERVGIAPQRVHATVDRHANTSAASIPLALADAAEQGRLSPGANVLLTAFGSGLTWASTVVRWG